METRSPASTFPMADFTSCDDAHLRRWCMVSGSVDRAFLRCGWFRDWDGKRNWFTYGTGVAWPVWNAHIIADIARINAETGQFGDPADGRTALSLAVAW